MNKKQCPRCKNWYPADVEHFYPHKGHKYDLSCYCRQCRKECNDEYRANNQDVIRQYKTEYAIENREMLREKKAEYYKANRDAIRQRVAEYKANNREAVNKQAAEYRDANRETINRKAREYGTENREEIYQKSRIRHYKNPEVNNKYARKYQAKRRKNPKHRLSCNVSRAISLSLAGGKGGRKWESIVGYTLDDLIQHLESQFTKGMTWDNHGRGGWHIDHIRPISDFNFTSPDDPEFRECWSLWNLQPLWEKDNLSKHDKCEAPPLPLMN